jgi:phenylacetate-CoA ligase
VSCGRGLPLLKEVHGRTNDVLLAEDGSIVHDIAIAMVLRDMPGVNGFKVIQETLQHCRCNW